MVAAIFINCGYKEGYYIPINTDARRNGLIYNHSIAFDPVKLDKNKDYILFKNGSLSFGEKIEYSKINEFGFLGNRYLIAKRKEIQGLRPHYKDVEAYVIFKILEEGSIRLFEYREVTYEFGTMFGPAEAEVVYYVLGKQDDGKHSVLCYNSYGKYVFDKISFVEVLSIYFDEQEDIKGELSKQYDKYFLYDHSTYRKDDINDLILLIKRYNNSINK